MPLKTRLQNWHHKHRRGDTLIEVSFAIAIFCLISVLSVSLMDRNVSTVQGSLELTMARNEIDAQAEALRYIHDSYIAEHNTGNNTYKQLWENLSSMSKDSISSDYSTAQCDTYYNNDKRLLKNDNSFILNTRDINPQQPNKTIMKVDATNAGRFTASSLYPRIIFSSNGSASGNNSDQLNEVGTYNQIARAEGIWISAVKGSTKDYIDYYIRTCWHAPGNSRPTTIATVLRLYDPLISNDSSLDTNRGNYSATVNGSSTTYKLNGGDKLTVSIPFNNQLKDKNALARRLTITVGGKSCNNIEVTSTGNPIKATCDLPGLPAGRQQVTSTLRLSDIAGDTKTWNGAFIEYYQVTQPSIASTSPRYVQIGEEGKLTVQLNNTKDVNKVKVVVGGNVCGQNLTLDSNRKISCQLPKNKKAGTYDIVITPTLSDGSTPTLKSTITYFGLPSASFSPTYTYNIDGGDTLTVNFSNSGSIESVNNITVGGANCTSLSYNNGKATCKMPGRSAGNQAVTIDLTLISGATKTLNPGSINYRYLTFSITYDTHSENVGWRYNIPGNDNSYGGSSGLRLEAVKIHKITDNNGKKWNVTYNVHLQDLDWQSWVNAETQAGTTGRAIRLEAIQIKLENNLTKHYKICYRAHLLGGGWQGWVQDGAIAGTFGRAQALDQIQMKVVSKNVSCS